MPIKSHIHELPRGLTSIEAEEKIKSNGPNELPRGEDEGIFVRIVHLFKEPMLILLILASTIYLIMGDLGEGILLAFSVTIVIGISLYQEIKSERALESLRELSSPRALVIRDGEEKRIPARLIVPDDLIVLYEGDRIPADGKIIFSTNLSVDESLLTGESLQVMKRKDDPVFSSTLCVRGSALARVTKTGHSTEVGKIGKTLAEPGPELMNLTTEINSMVRLFAWFGGITCLLIILIYGLNRGNWPEAFLVGLASQMSLMPEEFPVILTIFMALGAWRLSQVNVLVRKPRSIERLGAITALCVDKTGTLTENRMTVTALHNGKKIFDLKINPGPENIPEDFHEVAEYGVLASHIDPFDPMEKAILQLIKGTHWGTDHLHVDWELIREYPLSDHLLAMSCVWGNSDKNTYTVATKGAPETIIDLCHLPPNKSDEILTVAKDMATKGLRVLGVAKGKIPPGPLPKGQHDINFEWVGLIGLEDPIRKEVPDAVSVCRKAKIRVIMMTGDYPETAFKIAKEAGLDTNNGVLTGKELEELNDLEIKEKLKHTHVFARMIPEQKLRIVKALQDNNHIVGMTGDGVNDAPSLKFADVGIAMGSRGTDVAREASDLVLLDDNFASIISGILRGRIIFTNIRRAMSFIVSVHVPIAGLAFLPVLLGWPIILMPAHIVFLELIIDPASSLLFESQPADENTMEKPPRSLKSKLFTRRDLFLSVLQGLIVLTFCLGAFLYSYNSHELENHARGLTFTFLVLGNLGLIIGDLTSGSIRRFSKLTKRPLNWGVFIANLLLLAITLWIPSVSKLFHFSSITLLEFCAAIGSGILIFLTLNLTNKLFDKK